MKNLNTDIDFKKLKKIFPENEWDIAFLSEEGFTRAKASPIKSKFHQHGYDITDAIHARVKNGIILYRYSEVSSDYSLYEEAENILNQNYDVNQYEYVFTYLNFKEAALLSGSSYKAKNSLIYNKKFGFQCKICAFMFMSDIVNTEILSSTQEILPLCIDCNDCIRNCPVQAIHDGWIDAKKCDEFIGLANHDEIPSMKWFWYEKMKPIHNYTKEEVASWVTYEQIPDDLFAWGQGIDGFYERDGAILKRDGKPVSIPNCRECISQPKCYKAPIFNQQLPKK